ncbi:MAG: winged helix-turn-helix transcriptional regulator [Chitinophagaceae bacterium]|nr:winged helix-turn-helix transcriptional regulator [Chitinophagaceae bacterium]MBN8665892.1 winged helix-turn-helix transcriptional regulator [Chitinophagales bacterium]
MLINDKEIRIKLHGQEYHCAMDITMDYIGGKWKTVVLWYLRKDKKRFSELKKLIPGITEKMLSIQLKQLEQDGLIGRKIYGEVPPRVEYSLTDFGKTLIPMLEEIAKWGRHLGEQDGEMVEVKSNAKKEKLKDNRK